MTTDDELKRKLAELKGSKIPIEKNEPDREPLQQARDPAPQTIEGEPTSEEKPSVVVNIARGIIRDLSPQKSGRPPLPKPPSPPYFATLPPSATGRRQYAARAQQEPPKEEYVMAEELLPSMKKIVVDVPRRAAWREETPQAVSAAHSALTAQPQKNVLLPSVPQGQQVGGSPQMAPPSASSVSLLPQPATTSEERRLEREKRRAEREQRRTEGRSATSQPTQAPAPQALTIDDLAASAPAEQKPKPSGLFGELQEQTQSPGTLAPKSLFDELAQVSGPASPKAESVVEVQIKKDEPISCPTCKAQNTRVVFCPYCGTGMCANCSPNIRPEDDFFVFTCPHCSEEVNVKKRSGG